MKYKFKLSHIYLPLALLVFVMSLSDVVFHLIRPNMAFTIGFIVSILIIIDTIRFFLKHKNIESESKEIIIYHSRNYLILFISFGFALQRVLYFAAGIGTEAPSMLSEVTAIPWSICWAILVSLGLMLLVAFIEYIYTFIASSRQKQFLNATLFKKFSLGFIFTTVVFGLLVYIAQLVILAPARAQYRQEWKDFEGRNQQTVVPTVIY